VKQFFFPLTEPLGAIWMLMVLGLIWLLLRKQWRSAIWLGLPIVLMFVIGSTPLADALIGSEEAKWADVGRRPAVQGAGAAQLSVADVVLVLGGGVQMSRFDEFGFAAQAGWSRILTGLELIRQGRAKTLVLGGSYPYPGKPQEPGMTAVEDWLKAWGLTKCEVIDLGICYNTHDEAVAFKKLKQFKDWNSIILVTSALHLSRAAALFHKLGILVEPIAADFEVYGVSQDLPFSVFPRQQRFRLLGLYLHEKIGWLVYARRGWV
jgi:uncharacterized SAM-binding protein YcdF (DUF218 family)